MPRCAKPGYVPVIAENHNWCDFRLRTWEDAQQRCEAENMTLFQYDSEDKFYKRRQKVDRLLEIFYETQPDFGEFVFLGLRSNKQVGNHTKYKNILK